MNTDFKETIRTACPELVITDMHKNEIGQNNDVWIVNDALVFRFPKYAAGISQLKKEVGLLEFLKGRLPIPIPETLHRSFEPAEPGGVFAGYAQIAGSPLWKESLEKVESEEAASGLAARLAAFLSALHSIPQEEAGAALQLKARNPYEEMSRLYEGIRNELFPYIRRDAQEEIRSAFEAFLEGQKRAEMEVALIHGDFGASNILWDSGTNEISGIIDFGSSGLGDPAYDFAGILSSYGEAFFGMCLSFYPNREGIAERVAFYRSTFALQEALHGIEHGDDEAFERGISAYR